MIDRIEKLISEHGMAPEFTPYVELNEEADALTAYFKPTADYSRRLTDHVTLYHALETDEIVGCRIKGVSGILDDLPNYLQIDHDGVQLSLMFLPYWATVADEERKLLRELAKASRGMQVPVSG